MKTPRRIWTPADIAYLRAHFPHQVTREVVAALGRAESSTSQKAGKLGLRKSAEFMRSARSGRLHAGPNDQRGAGTRFVAGVPSWNAGLSYQPGGRAAETQFKPGHAPVNWKPVGSYRVHDGYLQQKVTEKGVVHKRWAFVHRLVWESAHGPVPRGHVVVFLRGMHTTDPNEMTLARLELVTRRELLDRNTVQRFPKELRQVIQLRGAITRQINKRTRAA